MGLEPEDFYIYQMGHLYKHYSKGGSGIRSVLDTYIYLKRYEDILDRGYLDKEFEKMGILAARFDEYELLQDRSYTRLVLC
jgi:hypothetical protein